MNLTLSELIALAEDKSEEIKETPKNTVNDVHRFVLEMKLKDGNHHVKAALIYRAYKMWAAKPTNKLGFFHKFTEFCVPYVASGYRYYKLNISPIALLNKVDNRCIKVK